LNPILSVYCHPEGEEKETQRVSAPSGYLYDVNLVIIGRGIHVAADGPLLPWNLWCRGAADISFLPL
jgi:hypothetical protein